jgi:hypothetical protein
MELTGAFSNPFVTDKSLLIRLAELHGALLQSSTVSARKPRSAPAKPDPVLETVTAVLELADRPMPTREIHTRACELIGKPLLRSSVKGVLSAYTLGGDRRFRRVAHGVYELDTFNRSAGAV